MDLDGLKIKPSEGMLAVRFLDEEGDGEQQPAQVSPYPTAAPAEPDRKLCLASVVAVGKKVEAKPGQIVAVSAWARKGDKIGDDIVLVSQWDVKAIVVAPA
jgi:hypothetical protein